MTSKPTQTELELFKPSPIAWKPHSGQRRGMKFLLEQGCGILAADPGVGKTTMAYGAFKVLQKKGLASKLLVIAPLKPCYMVWPAEAEKWVDFRHLKVVVLHGKTRNRELIKDADICVINPEGLDWLAEATKKRSASGRVSVTVNRALFKNYGFDTLVIDELTRFKHPSSGRFKVLRQVLDTFQRRWGLTGSLVANGLLDLFGQCYVIDLGRTFGQHVTHYQSNYFDRSFDGFGWVLRAGSAERIYERLRPLCLRLAAEDYVEMPDVVDVVRTVVLPPKVMKLYDELHDEMIAQIDDEVIFAKTAAVVTTKCRQVANGGIYLDQEVIDILGHQVLDPKRRWLNLHEEKVDMLESLVEELQGEPLLVAYDFEHDLDRLRQRFGTGKDKTIPYIGGGVTPTRFKELERAWNARELPILFGHPQSVAHGLNLQGGGAHHICWHSLTWDLELYDQFIRRIRRQGSGAAKVFNHILVAKDTIDETMLYALRSKDRDQQALFKALKARRKRD